MQDFVRIGCYTCMTGICEGKKKKKYKKRDGSEMTCREDQYKEKLLVWLQQDIKKLPR